MRLGLKQSFFGCCMSSQVLTSTSCYDTIGLFFLSWLDFFFWAFFLCQKPFASLLTVTRETWANMEATMTSYSSPLKFLLV